ncbi:hypothetical protein DVH24_025108 [Malus domestica]|uniref:Uncharacterized protein n=1 Tax=Malus domestica TaxID=3750 RepID=A0A498HQB9_MALDO|nr:hypothetical protein DVH24_025108 [Malus domestica]
MYMANAVHLRKVDWLIQKLPYLPSPVSLDHSTGTSENRLQLRAKAEGSGIWKGPTESGKAGGLEGWPLPASPGLANFFFEVLDFLSVKTDRNSIEYNELKLTANGIFIN